VSWPSGKEPTSCCRLSSLLRTNSVLRSSSTIAACCSLVASQWTPTTKHLRLKIENTNAAVEAALVEARRPALRARAGSLSLMASPRATPPAFSCLTLRGGNRSRREAEGMSEKAKGKMQEAYGAVAGAEGKKAEGQARQRKEQAREERGAAETDQGRAGQGRPGREVAQEAGAQEQGWAPGQPLGVRGILGRAGAARTPAFLLAVIRPFFVLSRALLFAAPLSGGPPHPRPAREHLQASRAGGRRGRGPAPAPLLRARACCVARRAGTRPSASRLASLYPPSVSLPPQFTGGAGAVLRAYSPNAPEEEEGCSRKFPFNGVLRSSRPGVRFSSLRRRGAQAPPQAGPCRP
jgi:uncharacterized protein YjbJ (UPF0337 family)